ncbi:MAG: response regulator [Candidatus Manganitrophus sp.]|nr:MAG: response regulator [Candidatus Manganitrophus sp.]
MIDFITVTIGKLTGERKREGIVGRKKILLVDDASTILMMEKMILAKGGYDLVTAKDGREAVEKAAAERPDLILMDVMMPNMTGFEACVQLRQSDATRSTPIILVTTRGRKATSKKAIKAGAPTM